VRIAIEVAIFYASLERWKEAAAVLKMVEPPHNQDPWGNAANLLLRAAYDVKQAGDRSRSGISPEGASRGRNCGAFSVSRGDGKRRWPDAVKDIPTTQSQDLISLVCCIFAVIRTRRFSSGSR